ncbi:hypothetical protein [Ilumatobacter sp.]|uniref:hypothetical protein n=1 Tax=Ilumatobacter sp. TaxID=1967498 RepID=UPI003B5158AB
MERRTTSRLPLALAVVVLALGACSDDSEGSESEVTVPAVAPGESVVPTSVPTSTSVEEVFTTTVPISADGDAADPSPPPTQPAPAAGSAVTSETATSTAPSTSTAADTAGSITTTPGSDEPATTAPTGTSGSAEAPADDGFAIDAFPYDLVDRLGFDAIGCWVTRSDDARRPVFFSGFDGALIVVDGAPVTLGPSGGADGAAPRITAGTSFVGDGYTVTFSEVGEQRSTSIESSEQDVSVSVADPGGSVTRLDGLLGCGV